jgi:hypothetical protein
MEGMRNAEDKVLWQPWNDNDLVSSIFCASQARNPTSFEKEVLQKLQQNIENCFDRWTGIITQKVQERQHK